MNRQGPRHSEREDGNAVGPGTDPWRKERDAFVQSWIEGSTKLSPAAAQHLREMVYADNGLWNDPDNVADVFEDPKEPGVIYIDYTLDGEQLEIAFRYL